MSGNPTYQASGIGSVNTSAFVGTNPTDSRTGLLRLSGHLSVYQAEATSDTRSGMLDNLPVAFPKGSMTSFLLGTKMAVL
jgi:hypothetical protein